MLDDSRKYTMIAPEPGKNRVLHFTMEPEEVLVDDSAEELTVSFGWQANFVPAPKKRHCK
jgi:hypothetical protein